MSEEKSKLRNKFVLKINKNVEKLTNDINLLMQVDKALNNLSGGGKIQVAINQLSHNHHDSVRNLTLEATEYSKELTTKIEILGKSIELLLQHINNTKSTTIGNLDPLRKALDTLSTEYDISLLDKYNNLYTKYSKGINASNKSAFDNDTKSLPREIVHLLIHSINSSTPLITTGPSRPSVPSSQVVPTGPSRPSVPSSQVVPTGPVGPLVPSGPSGLSKPGSYGPGSYGPTKPVVPSRTSEPSGLSRSGSYGPGSYGPTKPVVPSRTSEPSGLSRSGSYGPPVPSRTSEPSGLSRSGSYGPPVPSRTSEPPRSSGLSSTPILYDRPTSGPPTSPSKYGSRGTDIHPIASPQPVQQSARTQSSSYKS
jgi:hypothetical protein